jgi:ADP-ribosyl-[dinitrogen reductase] hydrolase
MDTMGEKQIDIAQFGDSAAAGALLGMAVGDALGTTYEFERIDQPPYPTLATQPATDVVGGGPFNLEPGQITDDTQMAICIARSLTAPRTSPDLDLLDLAARYVAWFQHAFDVGNQTGAALRAIEQGVSVGAAGRKVWHESRRRAAGNGSLMRCAPIGVFFARKGLETIVEASLSDALITHADPRCAIACAAFNAAIARGVADGGDTLHIARAQLDEARAAIPIAAGKLRELYTDDADDLALIDAAVDDLVRDLEHAASNNPHVYEVDLNLQGTAGFVRVAFRLAFWHLLHTMSWRDALTNAAIVGALLGSRDGVSVIPREWIDRVLAATQRGPADWAEAHHPKHLLTLAAAAR